MNGSLSYLVLALFLMFAARLDAEKSINPGPYLDVFGLPIGSDADSYDPATAHALAFRPNAGWTVGKVALLPFQSGSVTFVLCGGVSGTYRQIWRSASIPVRSWESQEVQLGDEGSHWQVQANEEIVLLVQASGPGVLSGSLNSDSRTKGYIVPFNPASDPISFDAADMVPRTGAVALQVTLEEPVNLTYLSITSLSGLGGISDSSDVSIVAAGSLSSVEVTEVGFPAAPVTFTGNSQILGPYRIPSGGEGLKRLSVRPLGRWATGIPKEATVLIDFTPPPKPAPPTDGGNFSRDRIQTFSWQPTIDTGTGVSSYRWQVQAVPEFWALASSTTDLHATLEVPYGRVTCRVCAYDRVGHVSEWSDWSDGIDVYPAVPPTLEGVETRYQAVNADSVWYRHLRRSGIPAMAEMSEDPSFPEGSSTTSAIPPVQETSYGGWIKYDLTDTSDGLHAIHHRLKTPFEVSETKTTQVFVDRVAPAAAAPVPLASYAPDATIGVLFPKGTDPEPSSGFAPNPSLLVFRGDGSRELNFDVEGEYDGGTSVTLVLGPSPGGTFRVATRAADNAGNLSDWVYSAPFEVNSRPRISAVILDPDQPTSDAFTYSSATATDPDGDQITGYRYWFAPYGHPEQKVEGNALPPGTAKRGEIWWAYALATDNRGATGLPTTAAFQMGNGRPSQPVVRIAPRVPEPGEALTAHVVVPSTDPDGDDVGYDFRWKISMNGGTTWISVTELNGSSEVDGVYTNEGVLWAVECIPYEFAPAGETEALRGAPSRDTVRVGSDNTPPIVDASQPLSTPGASPGSTRVRAAWGVFDPEGGPVTMQIFLTDLRFMGQQLVAGPFDARLGFRDLDLVLPPGGPYYLQLVATDSSGAVTQLTTLPIGEATQSAEGWLLE